MKIDLTKCKGCGICGEVCPLGILSVEGKKVRMGEGCVECKTCMKVCPKDVFTPGMHTMRHPSALPVPSGAGYRKVASAPACATTTRRA